MTIEEISARLRPHPTIRRLLGPAIAARRIYAKRRYAKRRAVLGDLISMLAEDPVLRVDEFNGRFAIGRRSDIFERVALLGRYEPELAHLCRSFVDPSRDAIDVGGNVGFFTVLMAHCLPARRVLTIEPTPPALERLRRNIHLNDVSERVIVYDGVAAEKAGSRVIRRIDGKEEYSSLGAMAHPSIKGKPVVEELVNAATIDSLVADLGLDPGFIKIDVEGVEHLVLQGAASTLSRSRPVILAELSDYLLRRNGSSAPEVVRSLLAHDYEVRDAEDPSRRPEEQEFTNILCLPKGRSSR